MNKSVLTERVFFSSNLSIFVIICFSPSLLNFYCFGVFKLVYFLFHDGHTCPVVGLRQNVIIIFIPFFFQCCSWRFWSLQCLIHVVCFLRTRKVCFVHFWVIWAGNLKEFVERKTVFGWEEIFTVKIIFLLLQLCVKIWVRRLSSEDETSLTIASFRYS